MNRVALARTTEAMEMCGSVRAHELVHTEHNTLEHSEPRFMYTREVDGETRYFEVICVYFRPTLMASIF